MPKIAIIKIGATGDVVRTSVLLHLFIRDEITWITARHNIPVLPFKQSNLVRVIAIDDVNTSGVMNENFDLIISLDDDLNCARVASSLEGKQIFGAFLQNEKVMYTSDANEWFDMGLSSRLGKQKADELKWENTFSYQEILFRMLGATFTGEEYIIREDVKPVKSEKVIGIEARAGARWPTKLWNKYSELSDKLIDEGYTTFFFEDREQVKDYMQDIGNTSLIVSGDTLGMHIGLALKIPVVAIFTCTSAVEIYGYNRMEKLVSPHLKEAFYKTTYLPEAVETISLENVYTAIKKFI